MILSLLGDAHISCRSSGCCIIAKMNRKCVGMKLSRSVRLCHSWRSLETRHTQRPTRTTALNPPDWTMVCQTTSALARLPRNGRVFGNSKRNRLDGVLVLRVRHEIIIPILPSCCQIPRTALSPRVSQVLLNLLENIKRYY